MSVLQQNLEMLLSVPISASTPSAHTCAPVTTASSSARTSARVSVSMFVVLILSLSTLIYLSVSCSTHLLIHLDTSSVTVPGVRGCFGSFNFRLLHSGRSDQLLVCVREAVAHCLTPLLIHSHLETISATSAVLPMASLSRDAQEAVGLAY